MGVQQSKPKHRQQKSQFTAKPTHVVSLPISGSHPATDNSLFSQEEQYQLQQQQNTHHFDDTNKSSNSTTDLKAAKSVSGMKMNDNTKQDQQQQQRNSIKQPTKATAAAVTRTTTATTTNTWLNRLVEPNSLTLHTYLDQRTVTDLFVDGSDLDDMPDFYDVESTISSLQSSALFSTLSSISPSSVSSFTSSLNHDKLSSEPCFLRRSLDLATPRSSAVFEESDHGSYYRPHSMATTVSAATSFGSSVTAQHDVVRLASFDDLLTLALDSDRMELAYCVAVCYYHGWFDNKVDFIKACHWFERAAILGNQYQYQHAADANGDRQHDASFAAEENSKSILPLVALAQYRTGKMLLQQCKDDSNGTNAWYYLDLAAKNGNSRAEYLVGWKAEKLEMDQQKAFNWYLSSWRHGLVEAQAALGCLLINHSSSQFASAMDMAALSISGSSSVLSCNQQALCFLESAADKGNLTALLQLGSLYADGEHVKRNMSQAIVYYKKASSLVDKDNSNYQIIHYMLGREYRYLNGDRSFDSSITASEDGTTHCHQLALEHFKLACLPYLGNGASDNGYVLAQRALAHMYYIDANKDDKIRLRHRRQAYDLFKKAAAQGDITAMGFLGEQYERGIGCKQDLDMAIYYYQQASKSGSSVGQLALALLLHRMERFQEALDHFMHVANLPSPVTATSSIRTRSDFQMLLEQDLAKTKCRARFMLARYLHNGWGGCNKDPLKAFHNLIELADVDEFDAAYYWVGIGYKDGIVVEGPMDTVNSKTVLSLKSESVNKSTTVASIVVIEPDLMRAFKYFEKAAKLNNDEDAQMQLANMCSNGFKYTTQEDGLTKSYKNREGALKWYEMAAQQHHNAVAQYCAGIYYAKGLAPLHSKNVNKAKQYYEQSAEQGYVLAMVHLAQLIIEETNDSYPGYSGHATDDDNRLDNINAQQHYQTAFDWLKKAAGKQSPDAYRELAQMCEKGYCHRHLTDVARYQQGFSLLEHPLLANDPLAWCAKSRYYEHGWYVDQEMNQAIYCLEQAVKLNYIKADLYIAECYERNGNRDLALAKYDTIIKKYPLRSQVGWFARLNICRMMISRTSDISLFEQSQILDWLHDMADQNAGEASIEPLLLLAMCHEYGIGMTQNLTEAKLLYEKSIGIKVNIGKVHWPQQHAYFRLAQLCANQHLYDVSFTLFKQLELKLSYMNHHSPETRRQARQVRYYLGYLILNGYGTAKNETEGVAWLKQAADEGDGDACYALGKYYIDKKRHDSDSYVEKATRRFDQGVSAGHPGCMRELAILIQQEHQADKDWDGMETYDLLERAQRLGDVEALVHMGVAVQYGLGTSVKRGNTTMALGWYRTAAQQGHPKAAVYAAVAFNELQERKLAIEWFQMQPDSIVSKVWLAFYRLKGVDGLPMDPVQAFKQLEQVTTAYAYDDQQDIGDRNALGLAYLLLGQCYEEGEGIAKDDTKAMMYYELARLHTQDVEATYRLGALLFQQQATTQEALIEQQQRAFECFDTAASKGNLEAKYMVGVYHARGLGGMPQDNAAAYIHLQRAIRDGHTRAILEQGHVLWSAKRYEEAILQFEKAAELKIPEAAYHLGRLYHEGVPDRSGGTGKRISTLSSSSSTSSSLSSPSPSTGARNNISRTATMILPQDYHHAFFYFMKAAEQKHAMANMMVGTYYQEGYDKAFHPIDFNKALHYYNLAYDYQDGEGKMIELAIAKLLHTMAEQETAEDQANKYHQMAFHWFLQASPIRCKVPDAAAIMARDGANESCDEDSMEQRLYEAQMMVAYYYLNGWGPIVMDTKCGFELLLDAANNGTSDAFIDVAKCYENGIGVTADKSMAYHYWSFAADMNLVEAMDRISVYYREGWGGLIADKVIADTWEAKANLLRTGDSDRDSSIYTTSSTSSY